MFASAVHQRLGPRRFFTTMNRAKQGNHCDGDGMDYDRRRRCMHPFGAAAAGEHHYRHWLMEIDNIPNRPCPPSEYYLRAIDPIGVGGWRGGFGAGAVHSEINDSGSPFMHRFNVGQRSHRPTVVPVSRPSMSINVNGASRLLRNVSMVEDIDIKTHIGPAVTSFGTICVFLEHQMRVEITLDQAVRIVNPIANCVAAIDARGSISCLMHPSGRVYQNGAQVDIVTAHDRTAKMSHRGIAFAKLGSPMVYLLDDGGARTTIESFADLGIIDDEEDFSLDVFYDGAIYGQDAVSECLESVLKAEHSQRRDNTWRVNGIDGAVYLPDFLLNTSDCP